MKNKILNVLSILFGIGMIVFGANKFFHFMPDPKPEDLSEGMKAAFGGIMALKWLLPLAGVAEIIGGILFLLPKYRALGAIIIFPVIVGILLTNTVNDTAGLPIALVFTAINIWVLFENRHKYTPMIS